MNRPVFSRCAAIVLLLIVVYVTPVALFAQSAATYYVSPDGNDRNPGTTVAPLRTIQRAIDVVPSGGTVIVLEGTYSGPGNFNIDFRGKAITLQSRDPEDQACVTATILDPQGVGVIARYVNGEGPDTVIDGFTIRPGDVAAPIRGGVPGFAEIVPPARPTSRRLRIEGTIDVNLTAKLGSAQPEVSAMSTANADGGITSLLAPRFFGPRFWEGRNPFFQPAATTLYWGSGDVDGDGQVTAADVGLAYAMYQGTIPPLPMADVDGDGQITETDYLLIADAVHSGTILPGWWNRLTTREQRIAWVTQIVNRKPNDLLTINRVGNHPTYIGYYMCMSYAAQFLMDGAYYRGDLQAMPYDGGQTRYNLPVYEADIFGHELNAILTGDNPLDFYDWTFIEPSNAIVDPGSWVLPQGDWVNIGVSNFLSQSYLNIGPYDQSGDKLEFWLDGNGRYILHRNSNEIVLTRPAPPVVVPDNRRDSWNPHVVPANSGMLLFEQERNDWLITEDIFLTALPFSEPPTATPLVLSSQPSRLYDVVKAPDGKVHLLWTSNYIYQQSGAWKDYRPGAFHGVLDPATGKLTDVSLVTVPSGDYIMEVHDGRIAITPGGQLNFFIYATKSQSPGDGIYWYTPTGVGWNEQYIADTAGMPRQFPDQMWVNAFGDYATPQSCRCMFDAKAATDGSLWLAWWDGAQINQMRYASSWSHVGSVATALTPPGFSLAGDSSAIMHLAYVADSGALLHQQYQASAWSAADTIDASAASAPRLVVDGANLHAIWLKAGAATVPAFSTRITGGSWLTPQLLPVRTGANAFYPHAALLPNGNLAVAWSSRSLDRVTVESAAFNPRQITVTADDQQVLQGAALPPLTYTVFPNLALDTLPSCVSSVSGSAAVGDHAGAITCAGAGKAGFPLGYVAGTLKVRLPSPALALQVLPGATVPYKSYVSIRVSLAQASGYPAPTGAVSGQLDGGNSVTGTAVAGTVDLLLLRDQMLFGDHTVEVHYLGDSIYAPGATQSITFTVRNPVTATITAADKLFDGTTSATISSCTLAGVLPADQGNVGCQAAGPNVFAVPLAGLRKPVTAQNIALTGAAASHYMLASTTAVTTANVYDGAKPIPYTTSLKISTGGPEDVVADRDGNLYVATVSAVQKIDALTGAVTLFAGGSPYSTGCANPDRGVNGGGNQFGDGCPATVGGFANLHGLAADATYLYISDEGWSQIHRVSLANTPLPGHLYAHELELVAGARGGGGWDGDGPQAGTHIHNPYGVAVDAYGNVFFADRGNFAIRMVDYSSNPPQIRTVAGYPSGEPVSGCQAGGNLSVTPSRAAIISRSHGLTFDKDGNLYFVDKGCYSLRKIAPTLQTSGPNQGKYIVDGTGTFSTLLGNGAKGNTGNWYHPWYNTRGTPAFMGTLRSVTVAARDTNTLQATTNDLYVSTTNGVWFYDAATGWAHHIMKSAATLGCAANHTPPYTGCPAPAATFWGGGEGARMGVDRFGNLYIADYGYGQVTKVAIGVDLAGTAPIVQADPSTPLSQTALLHSTVPCGGLAFATLSPFAINSPGCTHYADGDQGNDWLATLTYTPSANGLQMENLVTAALSGSTNLLLSGYGKNVQPVTVRCDDKSMAYGDPFPAFTYTTTPAIATWQVAPICSSAGGWISGSPYAITVTNCDRVVASGYGPFTCTPGQLVVHTPRAVTASVKALDKKYDGTNAATIASCTLSGVLAGDIGQVTCAPNTARFVSAGPGINITVAALGITLSGPAANSYALTSPTAITKADIIPAAIAIPYMTSHQASLTSPQDVVIDKDGNLYAGGGGQVVKIDAVTGVQTLFAGGGSSGTCPNRDTSVYGATDGYGDGCPAVGYAYLNDIRGLAVDPTYLYIADENTSMIHRVGLANTPLPGRLYAHELEMVVKWANNPYGITLDAHGNLFWGTGGNTHPSQVLMANLSTNPPAITAVVNAAGQSSDCMGTAPVTPASSAKTNGVYGMTFDKDGNLYMVDARCASVRKITPNPATGIVDGTGTFSTVMGNGASGHSGAWYHPWYNTRGTPAYMGSVRSVAVAARDANSLKPASRNLYISTSNGMWLYDAFSGWAHHIMKSVPDGELGCTGHTSAPYTGCPAPHANFGKGARMSPDKYGNLYVADFQHNQIIKLAAGTDFVGTAPVVSAPAGGTPLSQTALIHGTGSCPGPAWTAASPFVAGTTSCSAYADGDQGTDWVVPLSFAPVNAGYQMGALTTGTVSLALDGSAWSQPATVSCDNQTKTYGDADPAFTYHTSPAVTAWQTAPVCGITAPSTIAVTNCASLAAIGFGPFTCVAGQFTVAPRPVTATVMAGDKLYDGNTKAIVISCVPNVLPVDRGNVSCSAAAANFASATPGTGITVTATGISLAGVSAINYTLASTTASTTASILQSEKVIPYITSKQRAVSTEDVVFDRIGNMYVIAGSLIKKIDALTGAESVFAGSSAGPWGCTHPDTAVNGGGDQYGDGCPAVNAASWNIRGMAVDTTYLYVADQGTSQIHRIGLADTPLPGRLYAHELERVAGAKGGGGWTGDGPQATTRIHNPYGVAVDAHGNVFWADHTNPAIRMIDYSVTPPQVHTVVNYSTDPRGPGEGCQTAATGLTVTPARNAVINKPYGLTFDKDGNLYFVDKGCYSLRKVTPNPATGIVDGTGTFSTVMGNGGKGTYPGPWYNTRGTPAFVGTLRSVTTTSRDPNTLVSNTGDLYVSTTNGVWFYDAQTGWAHHIMKSAAMLGCAANGVYPYSGCPAPQATFASPGGGARMSVDQYGNLYVADMQNAQITKLALGTDFVGTAPAARTELHTAAAAKVLVHGSGICGAISFSAAVPFSAGGANCSPYTTGDQGNDWVLPLAYNPSAIGSQSGTLLMAGANGVFSLDGYGNQSAKAIPYITSRQRTAMTEDVVFDGAGNMYVIIFNQIKKIDAVTGAESVFAGTIGYPWGCAHPDTNVNGGGNQYGDGCPAVNAASWNIRSMAVDATYLYVADEARSQIHRIGLSDSPLPGRLYAHELERVAGADGGGGWTGDGAQATTRIHNPYGVAVDAHGNVFWADHTNPAIRMVDYSVTPPQVHTVVNYSANPRGPADGCQTNATGLTVTPSRNAVINKPYGLTFDKDGNLYFVDKGCYSLRKVTPNPATGIVDGTGTFSTVMGNGVKGTYPGTWYNTRGTPAFVGTLRSVTTASRDPNTLVSNTGDLYVSTTNGVWFYDAQTGWAHHIMKSAATLGCAANGGDPYTGCPAPQARFSGGSGGARMAVDQYGNLYVADMFNRQVMKLALGTDFVGTAPAAQVPVNTTATQTVLVHGLGACSSTNVSATPPWAATKLSCSPYTTGDAQTDWILSVSFTPTAAGQQSGSLSVGNARLVLDGSAVTPGP